MEQYQSTDPAVIVMELLTKGDFYDDLRLGIMVRDEFSKGHVWHYKAGGKPDFSFSMTLFKLAGGIEKLLTEWERVPW